MQSVPIDRANLDKILRKHFKIRGAGPDAVDIEEDGSLIVHGHVRVNSWPTEMIRFSVVYGDFNADAAGMTDLHGFPQEVHGDLIIENNRTLESLDGCTQVVHKGFFAAGCKFTTLKGGPKKVGGMYNVSDNYLESLEGAPETTHHFYITENRLVTLEGSPRIVRGTLDCSNNPELQTLRGGPTMVSADFLCQECKSLQVLEIPDMVVLGDVDLALNPNLRSLVGAPASCKAIRIPLNRGLGVMSLLAGKYDSIQVVGPDTTDPIKEPISSMLTNHLSMFKASKNKALLSCQKSLVQAGYDEHAKWD